MIPERPEIHQILKTLVLPTGLPPHFERGLPMLSA